MLNSRVQFMICQQLRNPMFREKTKEKYANMFFKIIFSAVVEKFFVRTFQRYYLNMSLENILRLPLLKTVVFKRNEIFCPSGWTRSFGYTTTSLLRRVLCGSILSKTRRNSRQSLRDSLKESQRLRTRVIQWPSFVQH